MNACRTFDYIDTVPCVFTAKAPAPDLRDITHYLS